MSSLRKKIILNIEQGSSQERSTDASNAFNNTIMSDEEKPVLMVEVD